MEKEVFIEGGWYKPDEFAKALAECWFPISEIGDRTVALVGDGKQCWCEAYFANGKWFNSGGILEPPPTHFIPFPD